MDSLVHSIIDSGERGHGRSETKTKKPLDLDLGRGFSGFLRAFFPFFFLFFFFFFTEAKTCQLWRRREERKEGCGVSFQAYNYHTTTFFFFLVSSDTFFHGQIMCHRSVQQTVVWFYFYNCYHHSLTTPLSIFPFHPFLQPLPFPHPFYFVFPFLYLQNKKYLPASISGKELLDILHF